MANGMANKKSTIYLVDFTLGEKALVVITEIMKDSNLPYYIGSIWPFHYVKP